jgi:hypothetical protein
VVGGVGDRDGLRDGVRLGWCVAVVGDADGARLGLREGECVNTVGARLGLRDGLCEGLREGLRDGLRDGLRLGAAVGFLVGGSVGLLVGTVGLCVGAAEGAGVGEMQMQIESSTVSHPSVVPPNAVVGAVADPADPVVGLPSCQFRHVCPESKLAAPVMPVQKCAVLSPTGARFSPVPDVNAAQLAAMTVPPGVSITGSVLENAAPPGGTCGVW